MTARLFALSALLLVSAAALGQTPGSTPVLPPETTAPVPAAPALPDSPGLTSSVAPPPAPTGPTVLFDTSMGRMSCKLFERQAPVAVANFIGLAQGTKDWTDPTTGKLQHGVRFYDGTTFHRVIPGFMIQGGDHAGNGTGDGGYFFANESVPNLNFDVAGRLAMANAGPDTNGTQFFVTELPQPELDGKYTIFGQCDTHSVLISASIARVDRDSQDKPLTPVTLNKVTVLGDGQASPPDPLAPAPPAAAPPAIMPRPH